MKTVYKRVAKQEFTYDGQRYKPGDPWRPQGFRNDGAIREHLTREIEVEENGASVDALVDEHTQKELRAMCEAHDLPVYGTKAELAERLAEVV